MLTTNQQMEIYRLASVMATSRVIRYRASKGLISTVAEGQAQSRAERAERELLVYIDSLGDSGRPSHPDNEHASHYWRSLVEIAKGDAPCE